MYVIIVYDVDVKRVNKVKAFLRRYLTWVQNSVFEGEITPGRLKEVKLGLQGIIEDSDSVVIYTFRTKKAVKREVLGREKGGEEEVI